MNITLLPEIFNRLLVKKKKKFLIGHFVIRFTNIKQKELKSLDTVPYNKEKKIERDQSMIKLKRFHNCDSGSTKTIFFFFFNYCFLIAK